MSLSQKKSLDSITAGYQIQVKLEGYIDDERQFKTAKRSQAPAGVTRLCSETVFPR